MKKKDEMYECVKDWERSKLSQYDFCQKNNIALGTFSYWRKLYIEDRKGVNSIPAFKPIKLELKTEKKYKITYPNGVCIDLPSGVDRNELAKLIRCLD